MLLFNTVTMLVPSVRDCKCSTQLMLSDVNAVVGAGAYSQHHSWSFVIDCICSTQLMLSEVRSCVKVEVAVLGSRP